MRSKIWRRDYSSIQNILTMMKKRGLSPIIATVLIILITVAAVAIIANFIVPFVRNSLEDSTSCLNFRNYFAFEEKFEFQGQEFKYNCFNGEEYGIAVKGEAIGNVGKTLDVEGFDLLFYRNDGTTRKVELRQGDSIEDVRMLDIDSEEIKIPNKGGLETYVYSNNEDFVKIEIYPVVEEGKICEKSDEITIRACVGENFDIS